MNPFNFLITENGDIDIPTQPGTTYLLTLKGEFDGAAVTLTSRSDLDESVFDEVNDAVWTAPAETLFLAPSELTRFTTNDANDTNIRVVLFPRQAEH